MRGGAGGLDRRIIAGVALLLVGIGIVAISCVNGGSSTAPSSAVGEASRSFLTAPPPPPPSLRTEFLRLDEVRPIVAFGYDVRDQPVLDQKQFSLTTLRGACGAEVTTPFRKDAGGFKVFRSTLVLIIEALADPGQAEAEAFMAELRADMKPDCPPFEEQLGNGAPSTVAYLGQLGLPPVGDQRLGWSQSITAPDGKVGYRSIAVVRGGGRVMLLAVLSTKPLEAGAVEELAALAAKPS